jgi:putative ABC transport system substrate-binding protein
LVTSLNRPGGNVTGVTFLTTELVAKRLDLLHQVAPQATTIAYLSGRSVAQHEMLRDMDPAAGAMGLKLDVVEVAGVSEFDAAFTTFIAHQAGALMIAAEPLFTSDLDKLVSLAGRYKLPAIYQSREFPLRGGLMSYGASFPEAFRLGARYVGQILKGAKPANLPVEESTRFDLVINLKTAKVLGIEIPPPLLIRADEVIE